MNAVDLERWMTTQEATSSLAELRGDLLSAVPEGSHFDADSWDVLPWLTRIEKKRRHNVFFDVIQNEHLRLVCKLWVLHSRLTSGLSSPAGIIGRIGALEALSNVLGARDLRTLKTDDFYAAERWLKGKYSAGTAFRRAGHLQRASDWLSVSFRLRLDYRNRLINPVVHGRYGSEEGRENKLLPNEVIRDMLGSRHRSDLMAKDRFFLPVFTVLVATGFRVGEQTTLPADCLLRIDGKLHILHYPEKGGKPVPRPIHPAMADAVEDAVNQIREATNEARDLARSVSRSARPDWARIIREPSAFRYFVAKWAHEWTANPDHLMINPDGAWYTKGQCFIDAIGAYEAAGRNKVQAARNLGVSRGTMYDLLIAQEAARRGELPPVHNSKARGKKRASWDTDQRVISFIKLEQHCDTAFGQSSRKLVRDIVEEAQALQLRGEIYPAPPFDANMEERFVRTVEPLIRDKDGNGVLYQDEALLVVHKYALSEHYETKEGDFNSLTSQDFSRWLCGEKRSYGTGNHEDSVFSRLEIIDPRTDDVAKFTPHAIRHWLDTMYENGGLTEDQIALIFNRRSKGQNAVYDQTSTRVRTARLKQAVRDKVAVGDVVDNYDRLAEFSREDAEDYLSAVLRMVNPMPHGVCMLHWATTPCPHHLSCFSCEDEKPCEHLVVEPDNEVTTAELERVHKESKLVVEAIVAQGVDDSPTLDHFNRIRRNVSMTLDQCRRNNSEGRGHGKTS